MRWSCCTFAGRKRRSAGWVDWPGASGQVGSRLRHLPGSSRETRVYLVDLAGLPGSVLSRSPEAGSERAGMHALAAEQLKEGEHINLSPLGEAFLHFRSMKPLRSIGAGSRRRRPGERQVRARAVRHRGGLSIGPRWGKSTEIECRRRRRALNPARYRDSALTWLLKDAITGSSARVCMVAAVHPAHAVETASRRSERPQSGDSGV